MNELQLYREVKQVMKYGISKEMAKEIVYTAYEAGKGKKMELYIHYAITLAYGLNIEANAK